MSLLDKLFGFGKDVILLTEKTERLSNSVEKLSDESRNLERRVIRIEALLDMARYHAAEGQKKLPDSGKS